MFDRPLFCSYDGIKKEPFSLTNPFAEKAIWQGNPNYGQYKDFGWTSLTILWRYLWQNQPNFVELFCTEGFIELTSTLKNNTS